MPTPQTAAERVRARLLEWAATQGHGARRTLANAVPGKYGKPKTIQWASGVLSGHQELRLDQLDAVAALLKVPPGDLVRRTGDHYMEVLTQEHRFVEYLRAMPDINRRQFFSCWDYLFDAQMKLMEFHKDQVDGRTKLAKRQRERELAKRKRA